YKKYHYHILYNSCYEKSSHTELIDNIKVFLFWVNNAG
ncbi:MAG: hypothetical protein ACI9CD_000759, partial [Candidatus Deianiraeaceae bacterium]